MIFPLVQAIPKGTKINPNYTAWGCGTSGGEEAFVYLVPNRKGGKPSLKRIRKSEWETVHHHLVNGGQFTRSWFEANMPHAATSGPCGFRVAGEVFVQFGLARRIDNKSGSMYVPALGRQG